MAYTSPPPMAEPLLKEKPFGGRTLQHMKNITFPLIRLAIRSTPSPVWEKAFMVVRLANGESVCRISTVNGSLPLGGEGGECNEPDEV